MDTQAFTIRKLTASEGHFLCKSCGDSEWNITEVVYLATNDTPDEWTEITQEQKDEYEAIMIEKQRQERENEQRN